MYKTCFECPHIKRLNPNARRAVYHCPKLYTVYDKYFVLDWKGHRPKICPLLKRNKGKNNETKVNKK